MEMVEYFTQWFHAYVMHFGAWVTMVLATTVYKDGAPAPSKLKGIVISALYIASIAALFSSHSHMHYLNHFLSK